MKVRLFFAAGLLLLLLCLSTGAAMADNGPHGGYTPTTDACAGCHRAHTAIGPNLLIENSTYELCMSCHGTAGTGADTNVQDGIYLERDGNAEVPAEGIADRGLKGGGFVNALMDTNWDGAAASMPTSSNHLADGSTGTAWGNGAIGSGAGAANFSLSCASCHDPHGGASTTGGPTYRILRSLPLDSGAAVGVNVTDETNKTYTVSDTASKTGNQYFGEGYNSVGGTWTPPDEPEVQLSAWCSQCHTRYLAPTGSGRTDSGDPNFGYRHMAGPGSPADCLQCHDWSLPAPPFLTTTSGPMWNHNVACMTCHVAHGSSAAMGGFAGVVEWPDGTVAPGGNERSSLLRVDDRGTCQLCHGK